MMPATSPRARQLNPRPRRSRRHGHPTPLAGLALRGLTLVEILLVLALLVVIGAISLPLMEGTFSRASLQGGSELLRSAFAKARLAAMQTGQTYAFRFEPNGSRFQILAVNDLGLPENNALDPEDPNAHYDAHEMLRSIQNRLPEGVKFANGNASGSNQLMATIPDATEGPWSPPVLFNADGTTSDASILLVNDRQRTIRVTLRGLTGVASATDVSTELLPE